MRIVMFLRQVHFFSVSWLCAGPACGCVFTNRVARVRDRDPLANRLIDRSSTMDANPSDAESSSSEESPESILLGLSRDEELDRLRQRQTVVLQAENELKARTVEALRRELKTRLDIFASLVEEERLRRRNDSSWTELLRRRPEMTSRVRTVCNAWSGPKKMADAKKLRDELEEQRRVLAGVRARITQEMKNDEIIDQANPMCPLHLQNQGQQSADDEDNDDTIPEQPAPSGPPSPRSSPEAAFRNRFGNLATNHAIRERPTIDLSPPPPTPRPPRVNFRQDQVDRDYLVALALQQAEERAARVPIPGRGAGRGAVAPGGQRPPQGRGM